MTLVLLFINSATKAYFIKWWSTLRRAALKGNILPPFSWPSMVLTLKKRTEVRKECTGIDFSGRVGAILCMKKSCFVWLLFLQITFLAQGARHPFHLIPPLKNLKLAALQGNFLPIFPQLFGANSRYVVRLPSFAQEQLLDEVLWRLPAPLIEAVTPIVEGSDSVQKTTLLTMADLVERKQFVIDLDHREVFSRIIEESLPEE